MDLLSKSTGFTTMIGFHLFQDTVVSFNYAGDAVLTGLVVVSSCSLGDGDCALFLVSLHMHVTLHVP